MAPRSNPERQEVEQTWPTQETARRLYRWLEEARTKNGEIHQRSERNEKFAAGEQWPNDVQLQLRQRPMLVIDEVGPVVATMTGTAALSRLRSAVRSGDSDVDIGTPLDRWVVEMRRRSNADVKERKAYRGVWIAGLSWLRYDVQPIGGRTPRFHLRNIRLADMMWDPFAIEQNLGDRFWHCEGRWIHGPAFRRTFGETDPSGKPYSFYDLWRTTNVDQPTVWPLETRNSYAKETDEVFLKTLEWRDVEPFSELYLPAEIDQLATRTLLDDPQAATETDAIRTAVSNYAAQSGFAASPGASQPLSPPADEQEPWQLDPEDLTGIAELFSANTGQNLEETGSIVDGFERDVFYRADLVGDTILRAGRIPEQCFTYTCMSDVMIDQARYSKPQCFIDTVIHRQMVQNQIMTGAVETAARAPKGAIFYQENAFVDLQNTEATLAIPGSMHAVTGTTDVRQAVQVTSGDLFHPFVQLLQMARDIQIQTTVDPFSQGAPPAGGDLRRVSSKVVGQVSEAAQGKHSTRSDALRLHRLAEPRVLIRQLAAYADLRDIAKILGPKDFRLLMQTPDRRAWVSALEGSVFVEESEYVPRERDAAWQLMWEQGAMTQLAQMGLGPPPEAFAEGLPAFFTPEMRLLWKQSLQAKAELAQLQAQIEQARAQLQSGQPPPQNPPPEEGGQ